MVAGASPRFREVTGLYSAGCALATLGTDGTSWIYTMLTHMILCGEKSQQNQFSNSIRGRLKICYPQGRGGSSPSRGTKQLISLRGCCRAR